MRLFGVAVGGGLTFDVGSRRRVKYLEDPYSGRAGDKAMMSVKGLVCLYRRNAAVATFIAVVTLVAAPGSLDAQDGPGTEVGSPRSNVGLAREAMIFRYRQTRDPQPLLEQIYAAQLRAGGASADEVVAGTLAKRREWQRLRRMTTTGTYEYGEYGEYDKYGRTLVRLLSRAASHFMGGGSVGVEVGNLAIQFYEASIAGEKVSRAALRLAEEMEDLDDSLAEREVIASIGHQYASDPSFGRAWDSLFFTEYGFTPTASDEQVLSSDAEYAQDVEIRNIVRLLRQGGEQNRELVSVVNRSLDGIRSLREAAARREAKEADAAAERRRLEIARVEREGYRSAVNLVASAVGLDHPELGRQIRATNDAVFRIADAAAAFDRASAIGDAMTTALASATLTWNAAGAAMALSNALMDSGPSPDELIVEGIGKVREDVQRFRLEIHERFDEMHGRFDDVRDQVDHVYDDMLKAFNMLLENNATGLRTATSEIAEARLQLNEIATVQIDTFVSLRAAIARVGARVEARLLAPCLRSYNAAEGDPMDLRRFDDCRSQLESPELLLEEEEETRLATTTMQLEVMENGSSNQRLQLSIAEFRRLLGESGQVRRADGLATTVVDPVTWFDTAETHDWFLSEYPLCATKADRVELDEFREMMDEEREALAGYAEAIVEELEAYQKGSRASVFSRLFEDVWNQEAVNELLARTADSPGEAVLACYWEKVREGPASLRVLVDTGACDLGGHTGRVEARLLESEEFRDKRRALLVAGHLVREWIALALDHAVNNSGIVWAIASGFVGFPDVKELIESEGLESSEWSWTLAEEVQARIGEVAETLRSEPMRAAVATGYGHRVLTGMRFRSLEERAFEDWLVGIGLANKTENGGCPGR